MGRLYPWTSDNRPSMETLYACFPGVHYTNLEIIRALWSRDLSAQDLREMFEPADHRYRQCYTSPDFDDLLMHVFDHLLGTTGIEGWTIGDSMTEGVSYCNTGDTYAMTIGLTPDGLFLGSWEEMAARWPKGSDDE